MSYMTMASNKLLLGTHCSIRKNLSNALEQAETLGCNTIQIFTRSPRRWHTHVINQQEIKDFNSRRAQLKISPLVIHIPYLPNLATSDESLYKKSLEILTHDLKIAIKIKADYFVIHTGAFSLGSNLEYGIKRIANAINQCLKAVDYKIMILIENVSGGGRRVGSSFEKLKTIIEKIEKKRCIGICLDTAHLFTAGYPLSTKSEFSETMVQFDKLIGLNFLKVIHLNDSMAPKNSRIDHHHHIGKGYIGIEGFKTILHHPALRNLPFILETPKSTPSSDKMNMSLARKLYK